MPLAQGASAEGRRSRFQWFFALRARHSGTCPSCGTHPSPLVFMSDSLSPAAPALMEECACIPCTCLAEPWRKYVGWMKDSSLAGLFIFEWTDECWKGGAAIVGGAATNGPQLRGAEQPDGGAPNIR